MLLTGILVKKGKKLCPECEVMMDCGQWRTVASSFGFHAIKAKKVLTTSQVVKPILLVSYGVCPIVIRLTA
jgi:hypothetical protein